MRKPTYSDAQIIEAGKSLLADQKPVSPFAIRTLLGGGNHVRIKQVWTTAEQMGVEVALKLALDESKPVPANTHLFWSNNPGHLAKVLDYSNEVTDEQSPPETTLQR